jgi:hypothetical protein
LTDTKSPLTREPTDIKALTAEPNIVAELTPAFEKYNEEQFITLKLPGSSQTVRRPGP